MLSTWRLLGLVALERLISKVAQHRCVLGCPFSLLFLNLCLLRMGGRLWQELLEVLEKVWRWLEELVDGSVDVCNWL